MKILYFAEKYDIIIKRWLIMRVAICDDEKICRNEIYKLLSDYGSSRNVDIICDQYSNGRELLPYSDRYDIIFMDHQMDELSGMETSRKIREMNNICVIIFISGYPEIAIDAFEVYTFRFLSKPVDRNKLYKALDDYLKSIDHDSLIVIRADGENYTINASDIIYAEAKIKHCLVRTTDKTYEVATHLKKIENQLPKERFARCQRSYIVGLSHIKNHTSDKIIFDNGEQAAIGKKYLSEFKSAFQDYIIRYNKGEI